jgi:Carboxypeptidase regulatory-like domain
MPDTRGAQKRDGNMTSARLLLGTILLLALTIAPNGLAEPQSSGSGAVSGVVIGPDDKPVAHALVTCESGTGSAPQVVHADAKGHFSVVKLRSDSYKLRASGKGVFSQWEETYVHSGRTNEMTLRLEYAKQIPKAYTPTRTYEQNNPPRP